MDEEERFALLTLAEYRERLWRIGRLERLCLRAAEVLEEEFGSSQDPGYGIRGPVHELIAELREAGQGSSK